jgi:light-regulated signal transduction histidine kinase (bacteriophytochrome)
MNLREEIENEELRTAALGALAGEQTVFEAEYTSVRGGRTLMVRSIFNPTEPGTSPTEVINTTEDITERKAMEAQIIQAKQAADEANKAKSDILANNAVKFTESGEIVVSTELLTQSDTKLKILFSVKHTGIGLTEEQISKLFQAFSQADTSTTRKFGGTGLGLTISKRPGYIGIILL